MLVKAIRILNGYKDRRTTPLPKEKCVIKVVTREGPELCEWEPYDRIDTFMGDGCLGTAWRITGTKIGFHAWEQNEDEFLYYKIIE